MGAVLAIVAVALIVSNSTDGFLQIRVAAEVRLAAAEAQINTLGGKVLDTASTLADNSVAMETTTPTPVVVLVEPSMQGQDGRIVALAQETVAAEIVVAPTTISTTTMAVSLTLPITGQAVALADPVVTTSTEAAATFEPANVEEPTATQMPTNTPVATDTPVPTNTPTPTATRARVAMAKDVPANIASTPVPPTPTATLVPATPTPTATPVPATSTPTPTPVPPTSTPTHTPIPPTPSTKAAAPASDSGTYTVESGDNWYSIAIQYGISEEALAAANGRTPLDILQVDEKLVIPALDVASTRVSSTPLTKTTIATAQATSIPTPQSYIVQRGDNWFTIAKRFGITQEALANYNDRSPSDILQVNQKLRIPPVGVTVPKPTPIPATPTTAAKPTSTPSPAPTPEPTVARLSAPILLSPMTGDGFTSDTLPVLSWQPVAGVTDEDYYYTRVSFTTHDGERGFVPGEVTGTSFTIPRWVFDSALGPDRITSWSVQVMRRSPSGQPIEVSPPSETRSFYWR